MTSRGQRGFSFIEVLVAMLVLGIAVLAFAGLQVRSLESTGVAHMRSQAMTLAAEFVERVRANTSSITAAGNVQVNGGLDAYRNADYAAGAYPSGEPATWGSATCQRTVVNTVPGNTGCSAEAMARYDAAELQFLANQLLPDGRVEFRKDCDGAQIDCVFVSWGGVDTTDCEDNTSPNCVSMRVYVR